MAASVANQIKNILTAPQHRSQTTPFPNDYSEYDTKSSDGEAPVLELWGMWNTPPPS